jgi:hypothetical protein
VDVGAFAGDGDFAGGDGAVADGFRFVGWFASGYCAGYVSGGVDALDVEHDQADRPDPEQEQGKQDGKSDRQLGSDGAMVGGLDPRTAAGAAGRLDPRTADGAV